MVEKWDKRAQAKAVWVRTVHERLEPIDLATCGGVRSLHSRLPMHELHRIVARIIPIDGPPPRERDSDDPHECNVLISRHNLPPLLPPATTTTVVTNCYGDGVAAWFANTLKDLEGQGPLRHYEGWCWLKCRIHIANISRDFIHVILAWINNCNPRWLIITIVLFYSIE